MSQTILPLLNELQSEDSDVCERAAHALEAQASETPAAFQSGEIVSRLIELMDYGPGWTTRQTVCAILDRTSPKRCVAYLTTSLMSQEPKKVREAAARFGRIAESLWPALVRETKKQAIPALREAAVNSEWSVRAQIIGVLGRLRVPDAVPIFNFALQDENEWVRGDAALALAALRSKAAPAVPHLIQVLSDTTNNLYAVQALGKIGAAASAALPHLERLKRKAEENSDDAMQEDAKAAIHRITGCVKCRAARLLQKASGRIP